MGLSNPGRAFPLSFLNKWACGWVVAWDWEVGRLLWSHLDWRWAKGGEEEVMSEEPQASILLLPILFLPRASPILPGYL